MHKEAINTLFKEAETVPVCFLILLFDLFLFFLLLGICFIDLNITHRGAGASDATTDCGKVRQADTQFLVFGIQASGHRLAKAGWLSIFASIRVTRSRIFKFLLESSYAEY